MLVTAISGRTTLVKIALKKRRSAAIVDRKGSMRKSTWRSPDEGLRVAVRVSHGASSDNPFALQPHTSLVDAGPNAGAISHTRSLSSASSSASSFDGLSAFRSKTTPLSPG